MLNASVGIHWAKHIFFPTDLGDYVDYSLYCCRRSPELYEWHCVMLLSLRGSSLFQWLPFVTGIGRKEFVLIFPFHCLSVGWIHKCGRHCLIAWWSQYENNTNNLISFCLAYYDKTLIIMICWFTQFGTTILQTPHLCKWHSGHWTLNLGINLYYFRKVFILRKLVPSLCSLCISKMEFTFGKDNPSTFYI